MFEYLELTVITGNFQYELLQFHTGNRDTRSNLVSIGHVLAVLGDSNSLDDRHDCVVDDVATIKAEPYDTFSCFSLREQTSAAV